MTKAELLVDLASKDWVHHLVDPPVLRETKPDGTTLYMQHLMDVAIDTAVYRDVFFYVYDEGGAGEDAFYQHKIPVSQVANAETVLMDEVYDELLIMFPSNAFVVRSVDAPTKTGYILTFINDPGDITVDIVAGYTFIQATDKTLTLTQINDTTDNLLNIGR